jgi:metal-responsive CopG/Arc/MetJ family transcriptional regulator
MRARQRAAGMVNVSFAMNGEIVAAVDHLKLQLGMPARAEIFELAVRQLITAQRSKT